MGEQARVESVDALRRFRVALCKCAEVAALGLDEADADIQRTTFWVKQDQRSYWKRQVAKRAELYARAKSELNRKKMHKTALGERCSFVDELKALAAAERRLEEARAKQASVQRWSRLLDEEVFSYKGIAQGLNQAIEIDVPNALAHLDNMVAALEAYASSPPGEQRSVAPAAFADNGGPGDATASMARATPLPPPAAAENYRELRARTPPPAARGAAPVAEPKLPWLAVSQGGDELRTALATLDLARAPVAADDRIVVACGTRERRRIYLERVVKTARGDSGWYVGSADDAEVAGCEAVRVVDLLAERPDLEAVLELPVGCLVVLTGTVLEAVLDPQDNLLWPGAAGRVGGSR